MSNYDDYFNDLVNKQDTTNTIDFGTPVNHKFNRAKRNYRYTHPNQLRPMTTHHSKKISHSKQNDLLGAIEMLTYKPPEILPISAYTAQVYPNTGKKKPFIISETENLNKKLATNIPKQKPPTLQPVVKNLPKSNISKSNIQRFLDKQKKSDELLQQLVKDKEAKVSNIPKDPPKPTKDPRIEEMLKRLNSATLPNQNLPMNRITSSN
jgi:hypothetical protein